MFRYFFYWFPQISRQRGSKLRKYILHFTAFKNQSVTQCCLVWLFSVTLVYEVWDEMNFLSSRDRTAVCTGEWIKWKSHLNLLQCNYRKQRIYAQLNEKPIYKQGIKQLCTCYSGEAGVVISLLLKPVWSRVNTHFAVTSLALGVRPLCSAKLWQMNNAECVNRRPVDSSSGPRSLHHHCRF